MLALSFKVRALRFFDGVEMTKVDFFPVDNNSGSEFVSARTPLNTKHAGSIVFVRQSLVVLVLFYSCFAEVINAVVAWVSVNVVYKIARPFSINIKPRKAVRLEPCVSDNYVASTISGICARSVAGFCAPARHAPNKFACFGVVVKQLAEVLGGQFFFYNTRSHDDSLLVILVRACVAVQTPHRLVQFTGVSA